VALKNLIGIDHAVVVVRDLDNAARTGSASLHGIAARTHSAKWDRAITPSCSIPSSNWLGVLVETDIMLRRGHFCPNAAKASNASHSLQSFGRRREEFVRRGFEPLGPTDFERPVTMPDGSLSAAKFRVFQWPIAEAPGGLRIFACQHKTRDTVWIPELNEARQRRKNVSSKC